MADDLVLKNNSSLPKKLDEEKDILSYYGIPGFMDEIVKRNKTDMLNCLACAAVTVDSINQASHAEGFFVHIPEGLRKLINEGKAHFDKSNKNPGEFSPNIRINGSKTIDGQATIYNDFDSQKLTSSISNLAMMAMMQGVMVKLDEIGEMGQDLLQGQHDDRVSKILGAFKSFSDLYFTITSDVELQIRAGNANDQIQEGLTALHHEMDAKRKKLLHAPKNNFQVVLKALIPWRNTSKKYQKIYEDFLYDLRLYCRLIIMSDIVLGCKGATADVIIRSHKPFNDYCNDKLSLSFQKNISFLMHKEDTGLKGILNFNESLNRGIEQLKCSPLKIECDNKDVKLLNIEKE